MTGAWAWGVEDWGGAVGAGEGGAQLARAATIGTANRIERITHSPQGAAGIARAGRVGDGAAWPATAEARSRHSGQIARHEIVARMFTDVRGHNGDSPIAPIGVNIKGAMPAGRVSGNFGLCMSCDIIYLVRVGKHNRARAWGVDAVP